MHASSIVLRSALAVVLAVSVSGCAGASDRADTPERTPRTVSDPATPAQVEPSAAVRVGELPAEGRFERFIVKYRSGTGPARDADSVQARLDAVASQIASGNEPLRLQWLRRLAVDADVFKASRPLERQEAARLMALIAEDPQVEYIELDGVATIRPGSNVPPARPLGQ